MNFRTDENKGRGNQNPPALFFSEQTADRRPPRADQPPQTTTDHRRPLHTHKWVNTQYWVIPYAFKPFTIATPSYMASDFRRAGGQGGNDHPTTRPPKEGRAGGQGGHDHPTTTTQKTRNPKAGFNATRLYKKSMRGVLISEKRRATAENG
jgi:hypothetical protein